jgi:DNA polymerase/3'-5' exonuclease PolX
MESKKIDIPYRNIFKMNQIIIQNLQIIQDFERLHKNPFAAKAYEKVIDNIQMYDKDIKSPTDLKEIKGIGKGIHEKISELLVTGKIELVDHIKQDQKYNLGKKLLNIYGVGPAKVDDLLGKINSFEELTPSMLNEKQKIGLKYHEELNIRIPIAEGKQHCKVIKKAIAQVDNEATFEIVGSFRRKNKDMGDIDILIKDNAKFNLKMLINSLMQADYIIEVLASGKNKFMGICRLSDDLPARRIDILVTDPSHYYFALLYFTGSYNFNIYMRRVALQKGLSLSEYGFKDNKTKHMLDTSDSIKSEEDIFVYLDIPYVPPHKR